MPSVTIAVRRNYSQAEETALMNAIQSALAEAFDVPPHDTNIILMVHEARRFMRPPDRDDPDRYTNITIVGHASRPLDAKRRLYRAIIDNLERLGVPRNCVLIQLHELPAHDIAIRGGRPMSDLLSSEPTDK
jgi:phenylpyruvate tautomerase PptA (4-oxalocrotonate tautomerase family)